jgi:hypothetical protein
MNKETAVVHKLKIWPEYFDDIESGKKPFEVRRFDRDFKVGDVLHLQEFYPSNSLYSGREVFKEITYILNGGQWGIEEGNCVIGLAGRRQDRQIAEEAFEAGEAYGAISVSNHYNEDYPSPQLPLPPNKAEYLSRFNSGQSETEKK